MEQIRRNLDNVAEGVEEPSQETLKFGSERRAEVLNSLNEKSLLKSSNKMQEIAKEAVRLNRIKEIQLAFEEIIKKNEAILRNLTDDSGKEKYEEIIKVQKSNLNYFNQAIEKLSQPKNENTFSANTNEDQFVEEMKKIIEKIYQKEKSLIFHFTVEPNEHYRELEEYLRSVTNIPEDEKASIKNKLLNENTNRLMNYFGKESFEFYTLYCNKLNQKIENLSQENVGTKSFSEAFESLMKLIDNMQKTSPNGIDVSYDKNSLTINISFPYNIIKKVNRQIVSEKARNLANQNTLNDEESREKELASFNEQVKAILAVYYEEYERTIQTLQNTFDRELLNRKLGTLVVDKAQFPHLTKEEKIKIINEIGSKYEQEKTDKYGRRFIEYLQQVIISGLSEIPFDQLKNSVFGTKEFDKIYDKVYDDIEKLADAIDKNEFTQNFIKSMSFDVETQKFSIEFANKNVPKYEFQIVSDKALEEMKNATTTMIPEIDLSNLGEDESALLSKGIDPTDFFDIEPEFNEGIIANQTAATDSSQVAEPQDLPSSRGIDITEPANILPNITKDPETINPIFQPNSVALSPTKEAAVNDYLSKVEELNNTINLINQLNQKLTANLIYDFLDLRNLENAISLENEAKELDQKIITLKLELSKDRIKFKQDFNEYIISIPQVKASKINDIIFNNNNLTDFVALVDEQLAIAENKIVELDKEHQVCTDPIRINEINAQITTILTFIENQNSLIARRIVSESENKDFDIVAFLQKRRENKKEIRERVKKAYENTYTRPIVSEKPDAIFNENFDENLDIKVGDGLVLPKSESTIPVVEPVETLKKEAVRKEPHYEIPTAEPTKPTKPKRKPRKPKTDISAVPETVIVTPQPVEALNPIEQVDPVMDYPEDDPRRNYALDDPMRYNKIPEVPAGKFDEMFETPKDKDDLRPIDDEYLKELYLNDDKDKDKPKDEPVIPESSLEEPENIGDNEVKEPTAKAETEEPTDVIGSEEILDDSDDDDFDYYATSQDFSNITLKDLAAMANDIGGIEGDELEDYDEDDFEYSDEGIKESDEEIGLTIPEEPIGTENDVETFAKPVSELTVSENPNETIQKLGHTIIEWTDKKGTIISKEFKGLYLSASNISEDAYNNALKELAELNVIDIEKFTIQAKMSEEEFEKVISEYNIDRENETIPKQVTIELRILELNPLIKNQTVSRSRGLILEGDTITLSQINNGIKVRYSEDLRQKLSTLNAKLRLIKKDNPRSQITAGVNENNPEQLLAFKDGRNINHEDYIVDIKIPNSSEPVFEYDLAEDSEERKHTL